MHLPSKRVKVDCAAWTNQLGILFLYLSRAVAFIFTCTSREVTHPWISFNYISLYQFWVWPSSFPTHHASCSFLVWVEGPLILLHYWLAWAGTGICPNLKNLMLDGCDKWISWAYLTLKFKHHTPLSLSVDDTPPSHHPSGRCCEVSTAADKERIEEERRQKERKEELLASWQFSSTNCGGCWDETAAFIRLIEEIRLTSWYGRYPMIYRVLYIPGGDFFHQQYVVCWDQRAWNMTVDDKDAARRRAKLSKRCRNGGPKGEKKSRSNGRETWWLLTPRS